MICRHKKALSKDSSRHRITFKGERGGRGEEAGKVSESLESSSASFPLYFLMRSHCKRKIIMTPKKVRMGGRQRHQLLQLSKEGQSE